MCGRAPCVRCRFAGRRTRLWRANAEIRASPHARCVDVGEFLELLGGVATRSQLLRAFPRASVDRAVSAAEVVVLARNRYALPSVDGSIARAHQLSGVLSHASAALVHGWAVKTAPDVPHVTVRRKRKLTAEQRAGVTIHYADLADGDIDGRVTSKEFTLLQCLRTMPFDAALAVADSALRAGDVAPLRRAGRLARGPGSRQVRRVVGLARAESANPFESVLRAIAVDVPGLRIQPQRLITDVTPWVTPDLVDEDLRIVVEADSFQWHGDRAALRRDARRYDLLVAAGWTVLRFAWEDVMFDPDFVRGVLLQVVRRACEQAQPTCLACHAV